MTQCFSCHAVLQVLQNVNGLQEAAQAVEDAGLGKLSPQPDGLAPHTDAQQAQQSANKRIVQQI